MTKKEKEVRYTADEALERVEVEMRRRMLKTPPVVKNYTKHLLLSQGKLLRTRALLACAMDEENLIHEHAVPVATAIEILHLATLVHDDIIDNADTRRGIATIQAKFGKKPAVICGDFLLCMALKLFSETAAKEEGKDLNYPDYISRLCTGELLQNENNYNTEITVKDCLKIMRGKTSALFEGAYRAGASYCGCSEQDEKEYGKLGRYIGMIFQLTDDCIDYECGEGMAKKPVQSDFDQGVMTLPLVHALRNQPEVKDRIRNGAITKAEILALVAGCGGVSYTKGISMKYYKKAEKILSKLSMTEEKRQRLADILNHAYFGVMGKGKADDQKLS